MKRAGWAELTIAALVIAVVVMLIVPLPRPLLDGLLTLNIAFGVALLMAALFTRSPLGFSSFPTLLVVTTLFRVGLEVSTTRLILAEADAGSVVRAFGSSVVSASLVVGLVVFAVITIVQLVVVARGAERVAEVAARFALDAMPGKQMAIDAELRTGAVDPQTARTRRKDLERESQLYGAMDGAMRFVKGDAIAAIIIVVINLVGGLIIGIRGGMTATQAIQTYSLLSIGAGLVAQIPSLLVAVASGLLVTRVASSGDQPLGEDLGAQLAGSPRALAGVAILLLGLALVPGLPLAPFLVLGGVAGVAAVLSIRSHAAAPTPVVRGELTLVAPAELAETCRKARDAASKRVGFELPAIAITGGNDFSLSIGTTPVAWFASRSDIEQKLEAALVRIAPELVTVDRTAKLVERAATDAPVLVREVVPRMISVPVLAEVLRSLVREGIPLADVPAILEAIALQPTSSIAAKDVPALVEQLRSHLRRQISARWAPRGQIAVYTVDAMIEDAVRTSIDRREGEQILALEPAIARDIISAVRKQLGDKPGVLLASGDIRRHLRSLLEPELPDVAVLAAHELAPGTSLSTVGRIDV